MSVDKTGQQISAIKKILHLVEKTPSIDHPIVEGLTEDSIYPIHVDANHKININSDIKLDKEFFGLDKVENNITTNQITKDSKHEWCSAKQLYDYINTNIEFNFKHSDAKIISNHIYDYCTIYKVVPHTGYSLPSSITCSYGGCFYDSKWGMLIVPRSGHNIQLYENYDSYNVKVDIDFGKYEVQGGIKTQGTTTVYLHSYEGFQLPEKIIVKNANYIYTRTNENKDGTIVLREPTDTVYIQCKCEFIGDFHFKASQNNSKVGGEIRGKLDNTLYMQYFDVKTHQWQTFIRHNSGKAETITLNNNQDLYIIIKSDTLSSSSLNYFHFVLTGKLSVSGHISVPITAYCYYGLFMNNITSESWALINAEDLYWPVVSSGKDKIGCCSHMFYHCTGLTKVPSTLPIQSIPERGCSYMFYDCISLTSAPKIYGTVYSKEACLSMFEHCTSLLETHQWSGQMNGQGEGCFKQMYYRCTNLDKIKNEITILSSAGNQAFMAIFQGCSSLRISNEPGSSKTRFLTMPHTWSATDLCKDMFSGTGGTYVLDPDPDGVYYYY